MARASDSLLLKAADSQADAQAESDGDPESLGERHWPGERADSGRGAARPAFVVAFGVLSLVGFAAAGLRMWQATPGSASSAPLRVGGAGGSLRAEEQLSLEVGQKRVVVQSMAEGMSNWAYALALLKNYTDITHHAIAMPCISPESRVGRCTRADTEPLSDVFDLSGWNFVPFDPEIDEDPDAIFQMSTMSKCVSNSTASVQSVLGPTSLNEWKRGASRKASVRIDCLDKLYVNPNATLAGDDSDHRERDNWPQFNFSLAREQEAADILSANGLEPAGDGREGNYIVYHWRSESVKDMNYTYCAEQLLSHVRDNRGSSSKRLVLVSDIPFNTSILPTLWATPLGKKLAENPTLAVARDMLLSAGFDKLETLAAQADVDLREVPLGRLSAWDAIFARGGGSFHYCRSKACKACSFIKSGFVTLLKHHYNQKHGPDANMTSSWMQSDQV